MAGQVSGVGVAYVISGFVLLSSGLTGKPLKTTLQCLLKGQSPGPVPDAPQTSSSADLATGSGNFQTPTGGSTAKGVAAMKQAAKAYGWDTGAEWQALNYVEMREAGFNSHARNPSSGALGMAQALGHGNANTAGSLGNEYGGFGLTDDQAKQANSGNDYWQAVWMCNYISSTYGDPIQAANHERINNWY